MTDNASGPQKEIPTIRQRLWRSRVVWILGILIVFYLALLWLLSNLIDKRALRREIEDQASYILAAEVTVGEVETDIRPFGGYRIRLRDIQVENISPDFGETLLACNKMVIEGSFYELMRGKWNPRILLKTCILNIGITPDGRTSLSDLLQPQGREPSAWGQWPLNRIVVEGHDFELEKVQINLHDTATGKLLHQTGLLNGMGHYAPKGKVEGLSGNVQLHINGGMNYSNSTDELDINLKIRQFDMTAEGPQGEWVLNILGDSAPLTVVEKLLELPQSPAESVIQSGTVHFTGSFNNRHKPSVINDCELTIDGVDLPLLGLDSPFALDFQRVPPPPEPPLLPKTDYLIDIAEVDEEESATVKLSLADNDDISITLSATSLNLSHFPMPDGSDKWSGRILPRLRNINGQVDYWHMLGVNIAGATFKAALADNQIEDLKLDGILADGKLSINTGNSTLSGAQLPESFQAKVTRAHAQQLFAEISHLLPPMSRFNPVEGRLTATFIKRQPNLNSPLPGEAELPPLSSGNMMERFKALAPSGKLILALAIDETIRFDEHGTHPILQALWNMPVGIKESEYLYSGDPAKTDQDKKVQPLRRLRILEGMLVAVIGADDSVNIDGLFFTAELGLLVLQSYQSADGESLLKLKLHPYTSRDRKDADIVLPQLNEKTQYALTALEATRGLQINCTLQNDKIDVTEQYIPDIVATIKNHNSRQNDEAPVTVKQPEE